MQVEPQQSAPKATYPGLLHEVYDVHVPERTFGDGVAIVKSDGAGGGPEGIPAAECAARRGGERVNESHSGSVAIELFGDELMLAFAPLRLLPLLGAVLRGGGGGMVVVVLFLLVLFVTVIARGLVRLHVAMRRHS